MQKKNNNIKDLFVIKYSSEDIQDWKKLFEELGSFRAVSRWLRDRNNGRGPSTPTIKSRLQTKFLKEGLDFNDWINQFRIGYTDEEVQEWKMLYERFGSFRAVCRYVREKNNNPNLNSSTVSSRIKTKSYRENWNFNKWVNKFKKGYSSEDIQEWKKLFEQLGSFRAVSRFIREKKCEKKPNASVIHYRLKKLFQLDDKNFDKWVEKYSRFNEILKQLHYTWEEMQEWENLFEQFGSFSAISKYLNYQEGKSAVTSTIIKNLKKKFKKEGRNFTEWVNEYFSPESGIASNIGRFVHNVLELLFIKFCLKNDLDAFYEVSYDNVIINPDEEIKLIIIDYTIASDMRKIVDKCFRGYHGPEKKLIIVVFLSDKIITLPKNRSIPFIENIEILNAKEFASFIGYTGKDLYLYEYIRYLGRKAFYDNNAYEELEQLSRNALNDLNRLAIKYSLRKEDFERLISLKGLGYLFE